jgi:hypothetical protein
MELATKYPTTAKLNVWALISTLLLGFLTTGMILPASGCSSSNVEADVNAVISATEAVLKVAEPNAPWVAPLTAALNGLEQAESQWKSGSTIAIVEDALNTIASVSSLIPFTAAYSPLIDILVAAIELVITTIQTQSPAAATAKAFQPQGQWSHSGRITLAKKSLMHPTVIGAIKHQWNLVVAANPALAAAKLK